MKFLALKIPPLLLMLLFAIAMWAFYDNTFSFILSKALRMTLLASAITLALLLTLAGALAFKKARTTVNPTSPESTSSLVTSGIYRFTRNPMYLGFFIALVGWSIFLADLSALVLALLFIPYMNKFQISPEEQTLTKLFGQQYIDYCHRVRRWC